MTPQQQPEEERGYKIGVDMAVGKDYSVMPPPPQEQWMELVEILNNLITDYSFQHDDKELEPLKSFIKSQIEAAMRERDIHWAKLYREKGVGGIEDEIFPMLEC